MNFECAICTEIGDGTGSEDNGMSVVNECGHVFHTKCVMRWFHSSKPKSCPSCRRPCRKTIKLYGAAATDADAEQGAIGIAIVTNKDVDLKHIIEAQKFEMQQMEETLKAALEDSRREAFRCNQKEIEVADANARVLDLDTRMSQLEMVIANTAEELAKLKSKLSKATFKLSMFEEKYPVDSISFEGLLNFGA